MRNVIHSVLDWRRDAFPLGVREAVTAIRVATTIAASPGQVWAAIEDIGSHTRWMEDAVAIHFTSSQRSGIGTAFDCETRVGPMRLIDRMQVTEWDPPRVLGIRHAGVVAGRGHFLLEPVDGGTRFAWEEDLTFPWWLAGRVGVAGARPVLHRVWRRSLGNLKWLVECSKAV